MSYVRLFCWVFFLALTVPRASLAAEDTAKPQTAAPNFELRNGDRVVFLGNTLIERAQKYGYWETMLTARYPDRNITFRNLGWSGDTVWAESRGIFDPPAVGYKRLIEHVGRLKPTVIFVGYGNNEAFAGKNGLPAFIKQYNKLLDDLTGVSAEGVRYVLLSPVPLEAQPAPFPQVTIQNDNIQLYSDSLRQLARQRKAAYLDLHATLKLRIEAFSVDGVSNGVFSDGMHLNQGGYFVTRNTFLYLSSRDALDRSIPVVVKGDQPSAGTENVTNLKRTENGVRFVVKEDNFAWISNKFRISGLQAGEYQIKIDGKLAEEMPYILDGEFEIRKLKTLSNIDLANGIEIEFKVNSSQKLKLRETIIEKNRLYFYRWRPQNITYLFGFRKHEQGQNAKELAQFDKLIAAKEAEINKLKKPVPHTYEIIRVKEKPQPDKRQQTPEKP